jgi:hypothetical protein
MCGRFTQHYTWEEVHAFLSVFGTPRNLQPHYNIAPTMIVRRDPAWPAGPRACADALGPYGCQAGLCEQLGVTSMGAAWLVIAMQWAGILARELNADGDWVLIEARGFY